MTYVEFRNGLGDSPGGPRRVGGPTPRSRTGLVSLGEVLDGSEDPFLRFWMGRRTLGEIRDG